MSSTPKVIVPSAIVPAAAASAYVSPAGGKGTWIDKATFTNYSAVAATISVNLVTLADTAGNQNLLIKTVSIAPGATYLCPELVGKFLNAGDFISWVAGTPASISGAMNGRELTAS